MKKVITILLSVLLIAGLFTGCNGDALAEMIGGGDIPVPTPTPEPVKYTVTFNSNGGEGSMEPQIFTEETTQALSQNKFTKYGYLFSGWSTTSSGAVVYTDKQEIKITAETVLYAIWTPEPFRFVAQDENVVKISLDYIGGNAGDFPIHLEYSTDGINWNTYSWTVGDGDEITLNAAGDEVYFRASDPNNPNTGFYNTDNDYYYGFVIEGGKVAAKGNIMFLLKPTGESTEVPDYCFAQLFYNCNTLVEAPALPATTLGEACYYGMFSCCEALTEAPALPAMTLANNCYQAMFYGCFLLTTAPELHATTLAENCYSSMFESCTSLASVTMLATDISADGLDDWLNNVGTDGTLKVSNDTVKTAIEGNDGNSAPKDGGGNSLVGSGWTVTVNP